VLTNYETVNTLSMKAAGSALHSIHATADYLPHLIVWSPTTVGRIGRMDSKEVFDRVSGHLSNLVDEEHAVVVEQLVTVLNKYRVTDVDVYPDSFTLHAVIEGVDYSMVVAVVNMMSEFGVDDLIDERRNRSFSKHARPAIIF
jgi:hypothetical protein